MSREAQARWTARALCMAVLAALAALFLVDGHYGCTRGWTHMEVRVRLAFAAGRWTTVEGAAVAEDETTAYTDEIARLRADADTWMPFFELRRAQWEALGDAGGAHFVAVLAAGVVALAGLFLRRHGLRFGAPALAAVLAGAGLLHFRAAAQTFLQQTFDSSYGGAPPMGLTGPTLAVAFTYAAVAAVSSLAWRLFGRNRPRDASGILGASPGA